MNNDSEMQFACPSEAVIGHQIHYYKEIGSTNDEAFRLGSAGAPHGTALIAEGQSAGKGRMQRIWHSPPGVNVYTSVILRPSFEPARAPQLSLAAGVAVAETLEAYCAGRIELKWPNDAQIGGKKVCGILSQMKMKASAIDFVVLGIGINVNLTREQFPPDIREIATSIAVETGRKTDLDSLINRLYENLTKWYSTLVSRGFEPVRQTWLGLAPMIGQTVSIRFGEEEVSGTAEGIDDDGSLILKTKTNSILRASAGDATIIKR